MPQGIGGIKRDELMQTEAPLKVVVHGALGKVGREVVKAVCHEPGMQVVGAVELEVTEDYLPLPDGSGTSSRASGR